MGRLGGGPTNLTPDTPEFDRTNCINGSSETDFTGINHRIMGVASPRYLTAHLKHSDVFHAVAAVNDLQLAN